MGTSHFRFGAPDGAKNVTYWHRKDSGWCFHCNTCFPGDMIDYGDYYTQIAVWDHVLCEEEIDKIRNGFYPYRVHGLIMYIANTEAMLEDKLTRFTHICTQCNNVFVGTMEDTTCPNCKSKAEHTVQHSDGTALEKQEGGSHYKDMKIQPVEFIHANNIPFFEANVIKYVCRWRNKNGVEDLKKAIHYLQLLIELEADNDRS